MNRKMKADAAAIKKELDRTVIGQEDYKIACAEFGYVHLKQLEMADRGISLHRSNMMVIGKSGMGKTYTLHEMAGVIGVDFFEVDGGNLSETSYKGSMHVDDIIQNLFNACEDDAARAERAIVFIDELDKIIDHYMIAAHHCDTGIMDNLLKLFEGGSVLVHESGRMFSQATIDTRHISWVCAGTFGLNELKREERKAGFLSEAPMPEAAISPFERLSRAGFKDEIIGRFDMIAVLDDLQREDYLRILTQSGSSLLYARKKMLASEGVDFTLTERAAAQIAEECMQSDLGARRIDQVVQEATHRMIFDTQYDPSINRVILDWRKGQFDMCYRHGNRRMTDRDFMKAQEAASAGRDIGKESAEAL